ncbi:MAG TPA: DMT family transporter [Burkholderiales bacterium]
MTTTESGFSRFGYVLLALIALGWGFNWPIIKIVLWDVPPLTFRGACLVLGGIGILLIARVGGHIVTVARRHWLPLLLLSGCNVIAWNVLVVYGIAHMASGRAALLAYTMPLWSMSLSVWLLREPLTPRRIVALGLGMAGVATLLGADILAFGGYLGGVVLMLGAAFFWGLGVVLLKRCALPVPTVSLTGWMMLVGGIPIALAALALEQGEWRAVGIYPALGLLYNIVVAFMFCYWAWNRIVFMVPVAVSSLSSLITPVVGVLSGMLLLQEQPAWREFVAGALILSAIALALRTPAQPARPAVPEPSNV